MRATAVLQKLLHRSIPSLHAKRLATVTAVVGSALSGGRLTLSGLARSLEVSCAVRHRIKRVDRLLGNLRLYCERLLFYRVLCQLLIGEQTQPVIIIDWSDLKADRSLLLLRASVWVHGFALTIYEEVHPLRLQHSPRVQREFLLTLRMLMPESAQPIVVSDAGFRSPWFQQVEHLDWHWVGRIRNRTMIKINGIWRPCKTLYAQATARPRDLGNMQITRANPICGRLALYRKPPKGRHHLTVRGKVRRGKLSRKNAEREREPWLIAASTSLHQKSVIDLVNIYRIRMRIEHGFRTLKSHQFGFAFEDSQTRSAERIAVLLLIHALALLLAWVAGWAAERTGLRERLASNVDRRHTTMSIITVGCLALTMLRLKLTDSDILAVRYAPSAPPPDHMGRK